MVLQKGNDEHFYVFLVKCQDTLNTEFLLGLFENPILHWPISLSFFLCINSLFDRKEVVYLEAFALF